MSQCPINPADWRKVRALIDERIALHQRQLESPNHDAAATAMLRGRVAELRGLIAWGEPKHVDTSAIAAPAHGY